LFLEAAVTLRSEFAAHPSISCRASIHYKHSIVAVSTGKRDVAIFRTVIFAAKEIVMPLQASAARRELSEEPLYQTGDQAALCRIGSEAAILSLKTETTCLVSAGQDRQADFYYPFRYNRLRSLPWWLVHLLEMRTRSNSATGKDLFSSIG